MAFEVFDTEPGGTNAETSGIDVMVAVVELVAVNSADLYFGDLYSAGLCFEDPGFVVHPEVGMAMDTYFVGCGRIAVHLDTVEHMSW